jgi:hypothetical protein
MAFERGRIERRVMGSTIGRIIYEDFHKRGIQYIPVLVDKDYRIVDWWDARTRDEALSKLHVMKDRAESRRAGAGPPYHPILIEISELPPGVV